MPTKSQNSPRGADVFINCPFDEGYEPIFRAIVFTIHACGYRSRCALEESDSGDVRLSKLRAMVAECDFGIHDLSRTELNREKLPRFNMPFELGLYLGAKNFGGPRQKQKRTLILAHSRDQWTPSISDLAGMDPVFHQTQPRRAIRAVRDFLAKSPQGETLPGEEALASDYQQFRGDLPALAKRARQTETEAQRYPNLVTFITEFLLARYLLS